MLPKVFRTLHIIGGGHDAGIDRLRVTVLRCI
jgi:hypothetical protein